jgi:hypothetical protein
VIAVNESPDPTAVFERYVKAWSTFDENLLLSVFTDDAVYIDPYPSPPNIGKAGASGLMKRIRARVQKLEFELGTPIVCRDRGIFPFFLRATMDGVTRRINATDVVVFRDGLIAELTGYGDFAGAEVVTDERI